MRSQRPALRAAQAWGSERDSEHTMAQVCSAADRVLPPGVLEREKATVRGYRGYTDCRVPCKNKNTYLSTQQTIVMKVREEIHE